MFEKVNPAHPDKIADRIAGAIVDLAYYKERNPKVACEVQIGHNTCRIINETDTHIEKDEIEKIVNRILYNPHLKMKDQIKCEVEYIEVSQDKNLANNQEFEIKCGDNGIFKGCPITKEQQQLTDIVKIIYNVIKTDGKYIINAHKITICQSWMLEHKYCNNFIYDDKICDCDPESLDEYYIMNFLNVMGYETIINPLGDWTGGINVDTGATNRKLGSDMGDAVTGGGLCLSSDSEYLGDDLIWHKISEYKNGKIAQWNDGTLEFVKPIKYIHNKEDKLIYIYNDSKLSMCLTPHHQVLIKTSKNHFIKKDAKIIAEKLKKQIGNSGKIIHNFEFKNKINESKFVDENDYKLQVAFCADGTLLNIKKWNGRIRVKKQYKKLRLRELLKNKNYLETKDGDYSIFWYNFPIKSKSLRSCFQNENWDILINEVFKWDGDEKRKLFRTTKKDDADFIQLVLASHNNVSTITTNKDCYIIHLLKSKETSLRKSKNTPIKVKYLKEKQDSYCFEVPSHNLIIRHNNKIFVTGNCGKDLSKADVSVNIYCHLLAQKEGREIKVCCAIGDKEVEVDGALIPYSEIVKKAHEYIKSIGGFEKLAEWGLIR